MKNKLKLSLAFILGALVSVPFLVWAVQITVPAASGFGQLLASTSTGAYIASSTTQIGTTEVTAYPNAPLVITGNVNSYYQVVLQNENSGATSSTDYIVETDKGNDTSYYGDYGCNSSGYNIYSGSPNFFAPIDCYLYSSDSGLDLASGTTTSGGYIRFFTGGYATTSTSASSTLRFSIAEDGHFIASSTNPAVSSCGTGAIDNGDDTHGIVTSGTAATACTLTFSTAYSATPACVVTSESATSVFAFSLSATAISVTDASLASDKWTYFCYGVTLPN